MIQSILDNDLYKFTMQQAVWRLYPEAEAEYRFFNRGETPFPQGLATLVQEGLEKMEGFCLSPEDRAWLQGQCPYLETQYLDYLSAFRFCCEEVVLAQHQDRLEVTIQGPWHRTILWEVPVMALISEAFFLLTAPATLDRDQIRERNREKAQALARHKIRFADFGTRRRFSFLNHDHLLADVLSVPGHTLAGTSNVHLARKWNLAPIGTMAHEWIMFHAALGSYKAANSLALDAWKQIYPKVLGIALTDTFTTQVFMDSFTRERARGFAGVRQDSGDPKDFTRRLLVHYEALGIDPKAKAIVFSDGLTVDSARCLHRFCQGRIQDSYGIGTHLTNDIGPKPLNMVIKLSQCRPGPERPWQPTVKLSDDRGKHTGDPAEIRRCLNALGIGGGTG